MYLIATLLGFLVLAQGKPYHGYEQPDYTLAKDQPKDGSFEVRIYPAANWTSVTYKGKSMDSSDMFMELFDYIRGENQEKTEIPMTVPVTIQFKSQPCVFCDETYVMSFYLPKAFQNSPPTPTNPKVYSVSRKAMTVYVKKFGGYAHRDQFYARAKELHADLLSHGITDAMVESGSFFGASYDSPFHFLMRRNEVWIVASK